VSDPSGAGTKRGIHNCNDRLCNENMKKILQKFVLTQNLNEIKYPEEKMECDCKLKYHIQKIYE